MVAFMNQTIKCSHRNKVKTKHCETSRIQTANKGENTRNTFNQSLHQYSKLRRWHCDEWCFAKSNWFGAWQLLWRSNIVDPSGTMLRIYVFSWRLSAKHGSTFVGLSWLVLVTSKCQVAFGTKKTAVSTASLGISSTITLKHFTLPSVFFLAGNFGPRISCRFPWCVPRKKPSYFPLYWLVNRDPYSGLL